MRFSATALSTTALTIALLGGVSACGSSDDPSASSPSSAGNPSAGDSPSTGASKSPDKPASSKSSPGMTPSSSTSATPRVQIRPGLPQGYPQAALPLVDGKVLGGSKGAFKQSGEQAYGWTIRVLAPGSVSSTLDKAQTALSEKGFRPKGRPTTTKQYTQLTLQNDAYTLTMTGAAQKKGGTLVIYSFVAR